MSMNYQITSDNMEVSPSMEELAKDKFKRIEHRFHDVAEGSKSARIVLNTAPEGKFLAKAHVDIDGQTYFANQTDYTLESSVIRTVEELLQMMDKEKTHLFKSREIRTGESKADEVIKELTEEVKNG